MIASSAPPVELVTYDGQISDLRKDFEQINDTRAINYSYSLPDLLMSVFAMFSLKYESLLDFEKQTTATTANLKNISGIKKLVAIPVCAKYSIR